MEGFELYDRKRKRNHNVSSMYASGVINLGGSIWEELGYMPFNPGNCSNAEAQRRRYVELHYNPTTQQILVKPTGNALRGHTVNYEGKTRAIIPSGFNFARHYQIVPERPRYYQHEIVTDTDGVRAILLTPMEPNADYWPNRRGVDETPALDDDFTQRLQQSIQGPNRKDDGTREAEKRVIEPCR